MNERNLRKEIADKYNAFYLERKKLGFNDAAPKHLIISHITHRDILASELPQTGVYDVYNGILMGMKISIVANLSDNMDHYLEVA